MGPTLRQTYSRTHTETSRTNLNLILSTMFGGHMTHYMRQFSVLGSSELVWLGHNRPNVIHPYSPLQHSQLLTLYIE